MSYLPVLRHYGSLLSAIKFYKLNMKTTLLFNYLLNIYFLYNSLNLLTASKQDSLGEKALIRTNSEPPGPKPAPGIVTT